MNNSREQEQDRLWREIWEQQEEGTTTTAMGRCKVRAEVGTLESSAENIRKTFSSGCKVQEQKSIH